VPTGKKVRELTGDTTGGTTLLQIDYALRKGYGIDLDTRIGSSKLTWDAFAAKIDKGYGAILQGSYSVIHGTKYAGDKTFRGNHAIFVPPGWGAMDPLCDGRRPGIYRYHGEAYPRALLKSFAGKLVLVPSSNRVVGVGYVWCALTRDKTIVYVARIAPKPGKKTRKYYRYYVVDGIITKRVAYYTTGFSANTKAPRTYKAKASLSFKSKRLARIITGPRAGWYINAVWIKETK
jgi:hypothetical protein